MTLMISLVVSGKFPKPFTYLYSHHNLYFLLHNNYVSTHYVVEVYCFSAVVIEQFLGVII